MRHYVAWLVRATVEMVAKSDQEQIQNVLAQERVVELDFQLSCSDTDLCTLLSALMKKDIHISPKALIHDEIVDLAISILYNRSHVASLFGVKP